MSWKPSATANDWDRWKRAEVAPPMTIERVTVEGTIQGKRAKLEMTQGFIQMQEGTKRANLALQKISAYIESAKRGNHFDMQLQAIERLCKEGLGE